MFAVNQPLKDSYREKQLYRSRTSVALLIVVLLLIGLVVRYFSLQVVDYDTYRVQSDRNRIQLQPISPKRGLIFDRNGLLVAENIASAQLTLVRERVGRKAEDLQATIEQLQRLVHISKADIRRYKRRLRNSRPYQAVPLRYRLSDEESAIIAANRHRLPGVEVHAQLQRFYPYGDILTHVLGYVARIGESDLANVDEVNYSASDYIGKIGLEKKYEKTLHGIVGYQNVETNARGRVLRVLERHDPVPGRDLLLHIDLDLQRAAHDALGNNRGSIVAIDPWTGGVLAMVSTPTYDGNKFVNGISTADYAVLNTSLDLPLFNRAVLGQYPPGSTLKPVFGLAGLHYGVIDRESKVRDPGWYQLDNDEKVFRDWKEGGHGAWVDLHQSIVESCDTFFYDLAFNLGIDRIHEFGQQFGLGSRLGVDHSMEKNGLLPSREWKRVTEGGHWYPGETLNVGIGQGKMLTTPLQLAQMTAVLATRGQGFVPRLVMGDGINGIHPPEPLPRVQVAPEHWDLVHQSMIDVVHGPRGTARKIAEGIQYTLAGKTGTAQVIGIAQGEEYNAEEIALRQRDHALFIAFAPAEDPQIALAVIVENGGSGSATAAPVARDVLDAWLLGSRNRLALEQR